MLGLQSIVKNKAFEKKLSKIINEENTYSVEHLTKSIFDMNESLVRISKYTN